MNLKGKIKNLQYFTKGKRGILYTADYKGKKVVIKKKLPESKAVGKIENEVKYLKILNRKRIGPKLLFSNKDYFVYEYIDGLFILDFIKKLINKKSSAKSEVFFKPQTWVVQTTKAGVLNPSLSNDKNQLKNRKIIRKIINDIFNQCFLMDKLKIDKEEMHHPLKHIIIESKTLKPYLVDFERCHETKKPKNVTQFSVFLISGYAKDLLGEKGIKIDRDKLIGLCKKYKKEQNKENLKLILNEI